MPRVGMDTKRLLGIVTRVAGAVREDPSGKLRRDVLAVLKVLGYSEEELDALDKEARNEILNIGRQLLLEERKLEEAFARSRRKGKPEWDIGEPDAKPNSGGGVGI